MPGQPDSGPAWALIRRSDSANVLGLGALLSLSCVVLDRLPVLQIPEPVTDDIGIVDKKIFAPVFRRDESITLLFTEPLDCTVGQTSVLPDFQQLQILLRAVDGLRVVLNRQ